MVEGLQVVGIGKDSKLKRNKMEEREMSEELRGDALVTAIAEIGEVTKVDAKKVLNALGEAVKTNLIVRVSGLGTFRWRDRSARTGRNPATGDPVDIEAYKSLTFKSSASVKAARDTVGGKKKKASKKAAKPAAKKTTEKKSSKKATKKKAKKK